MIKALIVEDTLAYKVLIEWYAGKGYLSGIELTFIETFKELLATYKNYDVIILDLYLDDAGPEEITGHIPTLVKSTPVIVASGGDDQDLVNRLNELGVKKCLLKTPNGNTFIEELRTSIKEAVGGR